MELLTDGTKVRINKKCKIKYLRGCVGIIEGKNRDWIGVRSAFLQGTTECVLYFSPSEVEVLAKPQAKMSSPEKLREKAARVVIAHLSGLTLEGVNKRDWGETDAYIKSAHWERGIDIADSIIALTNKSPIEPLPFDPEFPEGFPNRLNEEEIRKQVYVWLTGECNHFKLPRERRECPDCWERLKKGEG